MATIRKALIVGGGIAGMSAALELTRNGLSVDLIDNDPEWRVYGAGITITGPTLRAFHQLGILEQVMAHAYTGHGIQICNVAGERVTVVPTPSSGEPSLPCSGGIMRPVLHQILSERVRASSTKVRLGLTVDSLHDTEHEVEAQFSDGTRGAYDLVIGADGIFSRVRSLIFPQAPKAEYTGQTCWRLVAPRPASIERRNFFLGGKVKVGLSPVSDAEMYMFLLETTPRHPHMDDNLLWGKLAQLLDGYGGVLQDIRNNLNGSSRIVMRPLEAFFLPAPWHKGRTLLIGDAAHPTTPQLASGAGMAVEDALVLGQEISKHQEIEALFQGFMERRYRRCRLVVENSFEIGRREQRGAPVEEQTRLVEESLAALAQPI